ncbi:MAG: hypothetical protein JJU13_06390 [Balneolaceae bacterium]|nr:hypothetical protein [Balneolaceae bacterium]
MTDQGISSNINSQDEARWLPFQKAPEAVVITTFSDIKEYNLIQSLSGLAAKAVNTGELDEMIWTNIDNVSYEEWFERMLNRLNPEIRGEFLVWELVSRYQEKGIINGYVLYKLTSNTSIDHSLNVATVMAGLNKGVLIEESQEEQAKDAGLPLLYDARGKVPEDIYPDVTDKINLNFALAQHPSKGNVRDLAIAHNAMVFYGIDGLGDELMEQLRPASAVLGWNTGSEFDHTALPTRWGNFNIPSDWSHNLSLLTAATEKVHLNRIKTLDPKDIDWEEQGSFHSFIMSDGDNVQWMMNNFFHSENYWANSNHGNFPLGWTAPPINLSMMVPEAYQYLVDTQRDNTTIIEYMYGYQYPDLFATNRDDREALLENFAKTINKKMQATGTKVFGFILEDTGSEQALEAYRIYANEIEDLTGMFAVQYSPYSGGEGEVYWVENKQGYKIPVITAKYALWANLRDQYESVGNPDQIAVAINNDAKIKSENMNWTVIHAWSHFTKNLDGTVSDGQGTESEVGLTPVSWIIEKLDPEIHVVSPEELLWRKRMKNYPEQTQKIIGNHFQ